MAHHHDSIDDHVGKLITDFNKHTPDEQQHIMQAFLEMGAGQMAKMAGFDNLGNALTNASVQDALDANLTGKDLHDLYGTYRHFV